MVKKQLIILFLILWLQDFSCLLIEALWELAQYGWQFAKVLEAVETEKKTGQDPVSILEGSADHQEIIDKLDEINNKLEDLQSYSKNKLNDIEALIHRLPDEIELRSMKIKIEEFMLITHNKWILFEAYMRNKNNTDEALENFSERILSSIGEKLVIFRNTITSLVSIDKSTKGFFMLMAERALKQIDILCDTGETVHHIITRLFETAIETEIKAYILQFFALRILLAKNDGWKLECSILKKGFQKQFGKYSEMYRKALNPAVLPYIRSCDPEVWKRNENFYELEGLVQQTLYGRPSCRYTRNYGCARLSAGGVTPDCSLYPMSNYASCGGKLYNCEQIRGLGHDLEVCLWESGPYRIRYVKVKSHTYGTDIRSSCPPNRNRTFVSVFPLYTNDRVCSCQCHSQKWQILAEPQWCDFQHNFVIVGLRFGKDGNTIYIQIAQGRLEKNGRIVDFSWIQPEITPDSLRSITLENAVFYLEDLQLQFGHALRAIGLRELPGGFGIEIYGEEFNYELGQAVIHFPNYHLTVRATPYRAKREAYPVTGLNSINMKPYEPSRPVPRKFHKVSLRQSDIPHDFGQSTIPLFDAVPVMTQPWSPIGGVGLFLKVQNGYAGFLSLRLFPINYTYHMDTFLKKHHLSLLSLWDD